MNNEFKEEFDRIISKINQRNKHNREMLKKITADIQNIQNLYFEIFNRKYNQ